MLPKKDNESRRRFLDIIVNVTNRTPELLGMFEISRYIVWSDYLARAESLKNIDHINHFITFHKGLILIEMQLV